MSVSPVSLNNMATIYKRGRYYWVSYKDRNGIRIQESTRLTDRSLAEELRKYYTVIENSAKLAGTPLQGVKIHISYLKDEYLRYRNGRVASKTVQRDRQSIESLISVIGNKTILSITPDDLEGWYTQMLGSRSVATANCLLRHNKTFFNYAVRKRYLGSTPFDRLRKVKEIERIIRVLSRDDVNILLNSVDKEWSDLIRAALYTGARAGELCRLLIADIDLNIPCVRIHSTYDNPTKTRKSRIVPIPDHSLDFFQNLIGNRSEGYLLLNPSGNSWSVQWITHGFTKRAKKAGVKCSFHDLRRTYGAWLVMSGADLVTVQQNMGHSDISVTVKHYAHMVMDHRISQVNKFPPL